MAICFGQIREVQKQHNVAMENILYNASTGGYFIVKVSLVKLQANCNFLIFLVAALILILFLLRDGCAERMSVHNHEGQLAVLSAPSTIPLRPHHSNFPQTILSTHAQLNLVIA